MIDFDSRVYYVYQADSYNRDHEALVMADSEEEAIERHLDHWRDIFDKPADATPSGPSDTYAKEVSMRDVVSGELVSLV